MNGDILVEAADMPMVRKVKESLSWIEIVISRDLLSSPEPAGQVSSYTLSSCSFLLFCGSAGLG